MISKASAPGKVILFGEHFVVYGTSAVLGAIDIRVTANSEIINENKIIIESDFGKISVHPKKPLNQVKTSFKPFLHIAKKMLVESKPNEGIKIKIESKIPPGVGLGSSSACCVAAAGAVSKLFSIHSKHDILNLAIEAEKTIFNETSGADNTICMYGGLIEYNTKKGFRKIDNTPDMQLLVINSGQIHSTKKIVKNVRTFRERNPQIFQKLTRMESRLIKKALQAIKENDLVTLGRYMVENQSYLEKIGVSTDRIRSILQIINNTTLGAKITGAGGGGCVIALADSSKIKQAVRQIKENDYDCFSAKIDFKGLDTF